MTEAIPGLSEDRAALNARAAELVRDALARHAPLGALVLHLQPSGVTLERRDDLADFLRAAGVRDLAKRIRSAVVPAGHLLLLVDSEAVTHLTLVPVSAFGAA
jgi:hypothetical protein